MRFLPPSVARLRTRDTMVDNPNIRAVPNPPTDDQVRDQRVELIKTTILTSAVSAFIGVFAVAGGYGLINLIRRAVKRKDAPPAPPPRFEGDYGPPEAQYDDTMPESLTYSPRLRSTGRRRRATAAATAAAAADQRTTSDDLRRMLSEFEARQDAKQEEHFRKLERRIEEFYEDDEEEEDDD